MTDHPKDITSENVSFRKGEFRNDSSMVEKLPPELKQRILAYLKAQPPGTLCGKPMRDPITGKCYGMTNALREKNGFEWSTPEIYMFEHYDIRLSDEFLRLFEQQ